MKSIVVPQTPIPLFINSDGLYRAEPDSVNFIVHGSTFSPAIELAGGSTAVVTWYDENENLLATGNTPLIDFGSAAAREVRMRVRVASDLSWDDVLTVNLGFNHSDDAGRYNIGSSYNKSPELVTGVSNVTLLKGLRRFLAANVSSATQALTGHLDLSGLSALEYVECYYARLTSVNLEGCTSIIRVCLEANDLTHLDLNPISATVRDVRAARQRNRPGANGSPTLTLEPLTAPLANCYHFCFQNCYNIANFPAWDRFPVIEELWCWNCGLSGHFAPISPLLYTPRMSGNDYTTANITGLNAIQGLDLIGNNLDTASIDHILAEMESFNTDPGQYVGYVRLNGSGMSGPTSAGEAAAQALEARGWDVDRNAVVATPDTQAPTVPTGLAASNITESGFSLAWNASTDDVAVTQYEVTANGVVVATPATNSVTLNSLDSGTAYTVTVRARDAAGNWSAMSTSITESTSVSSDAEAPTVPTGLVATDVTHNAASITWNPSTDNVGVTQYEIRRNGTPVGTTSTTSFTLTSLSPQTTYPIEVRARDAAGNWSNTSAPLNITTDETPSTPGVLWSDDFERADAVGLAAVGNGWTDHGGAASTDGDIVGGNFIRRQVSGSATYARTGNAAGGALPANIALEVDLPDATVGVWMGFYARWDGTNGVRVMVNNTTISIGNASTYNANNVSVTAVNAIPASWGTNGTNTARVEFEGTTVRLFLNGVHVSTATVSINATLTGGAVGLCGQPLDRAYNAVRVSSL